MTLIRCHYPDDIVSGNAFTPNVCCAQKLSALILLVRIITLQPLHSLLFDTTRSFLAKQLEDVFVFFLSALSENGYQGS